MKMIQSIERMGEILTYLAPKTNGERLTVISKDLGLNKSTAFGIISTLEQLGYIEQDQETGKYYLGLGLFALGQAAYNRLDIISVAKPHLTELSKKYGETAHIAVLSDTVVVYLDKVEGRRAVTVSTYIGGKQPIHCTGLGKVLLAYMPEDVIDDITDRLDYIKYTDTTITSKKEMLKELETIRKQGYAIDNEESEEGLYCVAAPVFYGDGKKVAAISVAGMVTRIRDDGGEALVNDLVKTARTISKKLGWK